MSKATLMSTVERTGAADVFTMPLDAARLKDLPRVGGKAAHLGELLAVGLPVPSGFIVTTEACQRFIESDPRIADWLRTLERCGPRDPAALRAAAEAVRHQLEAIPMPGDVADAITSALTLPPNGARAVRSSATVEDLPEASFAGQHDSFLNVRGGEPILAAVKHCWLSLFSERAISYRLRKGVAPGRAQMAVIVQQLLAADAAGVMFTADPAGRDAHTILIEAAFGLGEAVVQGKVAPDRVAVSRASQRVIRRDIGLKQIQVVPSESGVSEQPLPAEKGRALVLDDDTAARLARLGLEAERFLGRPLDIEWGLREGRLWLLQARPVTTVAPAPATFEDRQVWTNANTGEVMPDVVTPLTLSLLLSLVATLFNRLLWSGGMRVKIEQLCGLIAGRLYFNFNTIYALSCRIPGTKYQAVEEMFGGQQDTLLALKQIHFTPADLPRIDLNYWRAAVGLPALALRFLCYSTRHGDTAMASARRADEDLDRAEPGRLSDEELRTTIQAASTPALLRDVKALETFSFGLSYTTLLFAACDRWFGSEGRSLANRLLAGVGEMDTAVIGHDLWLLAEQAAKEPPIQAALRRERTFTAFVSRLDGSAASQAFLAQWNTFMRRHGHHTRGELEMFNPRWSECPDLVLDMVRGYVEAINAGHPSPVARQDALAAERITLTDKCLRRLRNPLKRALFRVVVHRAQKGGRFRENLKSEAIRQFAVLRRLLLELGRRLANRGRLADPNDIFFLEIKEMQSASLWDPHTDLRPRVAARRALYERDLKLTPPTVIVGRFDPDRFVPAAIDRATKEFRGLGASAGKAKGRARVILRSDTDERVQPGEILVAPFTDPGWTPYFLSAAGIVMDLGGMLSHGSIVAREYGIPAVVNVGPATQIIRTGQWLEVDADQGVVRVLEAAQG
jgi:rifampicin phosphotransferase